MATTDNAVYFCGYLPDHFTGWGGSGAPSYSAVGAPTGTSSQPNVPYEISLATSLPALDNGLHGCLWGNFADPDTASSITLSTFWASMVLWLYYTDAPDATTMAGYVPIIFHASNGYLVITPVPSTANQYKFYLTPTFSDSTQYIDLGLQFSSTSTTSPNNVTFSVVGGGTTSGTITAYNNGVLIGTWSGDLTNYSDFSAVSFHAVYESSTKILNFFYCLVTNFSLVNNFLDVRKTTGLGTDTDWGTNTASFATMPTNYTDYTDGLYGDNVGDKMTLTYEATPATVGYEPKAVCITNSMVTGTAGGDIEVQGLIRDTANGTETTTDTHPVSTTGAADTMSMTVNPETGQKWTLAEINATEFGLVRTK